MLVFISSAFLVLSACSFKKGGEDKTQTSPNTAKESAPTRPQNIFEALANLDNQVALEYIAQADVNEVNAYNEEGLTPLMVAVRSAKGPLVEALLKKGALPLKPEKSGQNNSRTLELASSSYISNLLKNAIEAEKNQVSALISKGNFKQAYSYLLGYYLKISDRLAGENTFISLVYENRALDLAAATDTAIKVLEADKLSNSETEKLWNLSFEARSSQLLKSLLTTHPLPAADKLTSLAEKAVMDWKLEVLEKVNQAGLFLMLDLSSEQEAYVRYLIDQKDRKVLDVNRIKADLVLLEKNSAKKNFCESCFEAILSARLVSSTQMKLIAALIETSKSNDADFLAKILPRLSEKDAQTLLENLNSEILKTQKNALSAAAFQTDLTEENVGKLTSLKKRGLALSAEESQALFAKLFQASLDGQTSATKMLEILTPDFIRNRASFKLTKHDLQLMASREAFRLLGADSFTIGIMTILKSLNDGPFTALLVGSKTMRGEPVELSVDFDYYLDQKFEEYVGDKDRVQSIKQRQILSLKDGLNFAFSNSENLIHFYHDKDLVTLSKFDIVILSALAHELAPSSDLAKTKYIVKDLLRYSLVNKTEAINNLFAEEAKAPSDIKASHRVKYLSSIAKMPLSDAVALALHGFVVTSDFNFSQQADTLASSFTSLLVPNMPNRTFVLTLTKSYLAKQNPRLFVALHGKMEQYRKFIMGDLSYDPLCKDKLPDADGIVAAYQSENIHLELSSSDLDDLKNVCDFKLPQRREIVKTSYPETDLKNTLKELAAFKKEEAFFYLSRLSNDQIWVDSLTKLRGSMTSYQFDKLDLYGLKSTDFPLSVKYLSEDGAGLMKFIKKNLSSK